MSDHIRYHADGPVGTITINRPAKRNAMMAEALMLAKDDIAWLPLHQQPLSWAARDTVEVPQAADDLVRLWYARVTK